MIATSKKWETCGNRIEKNPINKKWVADKFYTEKIDDLISTTPTGTTKNKAVNKCALKPEKLWARAVNSAFNGRR